VVATRFPLLKPLNQKKKKRLPPTTPAVCNNVGTSDAIKGRQDACVSERPNHHTITVEEEERMLTSIAMQQTRSTRLCRDTRTEKDTAQVNGLGCGRYIRIDA
jgi:hypothetical protein